MEDAEKNINNLTIAGKKEVEKFADTLAGTSTTEFKAIKKWDHIAVRPETFLEFRKKRGDKFSSDDAFIKYLIAEVRIRDPAYEAEYDKWVKENLNQQEVQDETNKAIID